MEMKRLSPKWLLWGVLLPLSFMACQKGGLFDFADGIIFNVNTGILKSPLSISFANGNPTSSVVPNFIQVDVLGDGADKLFSLPGEKDFLAIDGLITIGIRDDEDPPTPQNPVKFVVKAEAPGFLPTFYEFKIHDLDQPQHVTLFLLPEQELPEGVSQWSGDLSLPDGQLTEALLWESPLTTGKQEKITLSLDPGTVLLLPSGAPVSGALSARLIHFDNRAPFALSSKEGLLDQVEARDLQGQNLGNVAMFPAFLYDLQLEQDEKTVSAFSQPIQVTGNLNPETFNPLTGDYIQPGDLLPVWRWNPDAQRWDQQAEAVISETNGQLSISYEQRLAETWMAGFALATCTQESFVEVFSHIQSSDPERSFFIELVDVATLHPVSPKWSSHYQSLENGVKLTLRDLPEDLLLKLRVWEGVRHCKGVLLAESGPLLPCTDGQKIDLRAELSGHQWNTVDFEILGRCGDQLVAPEGTLLYRPSGCGSYGYLGTIEKGAVSTGALSFGQAYDFKVRFGESVFEYQDFLVQSNRVEWEGLTLPSNYCALAE